MPDSTRPEEVPAVAHVAGAIEDTVRGAVQATTRRRAIPHEIGVETISVDEITGTGVGPPRAGGLDFIPPRLARTRHRTTASVSSLVRRADGTEVVNVTGAVLIELTPPRERTEVGR